MTSQEESTPGPSLPPNPPTAADRPPVRPELDHARELIKHDLLVYMKLEYGLELKDDEAAIALEWAATRIARKEFFAIASAEWQPNFIPATPDEVARWVYIAVGGSDADSVAHGVPSWFRTGVIGGLLQAFDAFIAGTADDDDTEVVATHYAAKRIAGMFRGDVPSEVG